METPKAAHTNGHRYSSIEPAWGQDHDRLRDAMASSGIAILAFDCDLHLQIFTPAATTLLHLSDNDIGQHLSQLSKEFMNDDLLLDAQSVVETGVSLLREMSFESGALYNQRLLPYRSLNGTVKGVIITFADISEMRLVRRAIDDARAYSNSIIDAIRLPMVVLDDKQRILSASLPFYRSSPSTRVMPLASG